MVFVDFNFSGDFTNSGANDITYTFDYTLDPAQPVINGASLSLDPGGLLTENICAGGIYTSQISGFTCAPAGPITPFPTSLFVNDIPPTPQPSASTSFSPPNSFHLVDYHLILDLPPGASAGSFDSGTVTALGPNTGVPEPASIIPAAAGLLGVLGFRSRWRLRRAFFKSLRASN